MDICLRFDAIQARSFAKKYVMNRIKLMGIIALLSTQLQAQYAPFLNEKFKFSLVFGLNQPIVTQGFNLEANYYTKYFVFDYSHGFNLHFKDKLVTGEAKRQGLKFKISHSLGVGFGYRITRDFNLRIEPKLHVWNIYADDKPFSKEHILKTYSTYTLGLGAYYRLQPFRNAQNWSKGITAVPSIRWWPNVASSLQNNEFSYFNRLTNKTEIHKANNIGIANTAFFGNISLGYSF
jgi:hypothetical protein